MRCLGLSAVILLVRASNSFVSNSDHERCFSTLETIASNEKQQGRLNHSSWGDVASQYRALVCGGSSSAVIPAQGGAMFELVMDSMEEKNITSFLPIVNDAKHQQLCSYLEAFAVGPGCSVESEEASQRRRAQDESCALELLAFVQSDTDGHLNLIEYNHFFTNRYYSRCGLAFEVDETSGVSKAQTDAFVSLSCLACLREIGTVTTLPDCCRPNRARISLQNPDAFTFARICASARAAAAEDCSHLALLTTAQPQVAQRPTPSIVPPSSFQAPVRVPRPNPATQPVGSPMSNRIEPGPTWQISTQSLPECSKQLVLSDSNPSDGVLSSGEFQAFLVYRFGRDCTVRHPAMAIQGLFLQLACSSCLSGMGANLDCCLPNVARISISDAYSGEETNWINRICFNVDSQIEATCQAGNPVASPVSRPVSSPVAPPIRIPQTPPQTPPRTPPTPFRPNNPPSPVFRPTPPTIMPLTFAPVSFPSMITPIQKSTSVPSSPSGIAQPTTTPTSFPVDISRHSSPAPTKPSFIGDSTTRSPIDPIVLTKEPTYPPVVGPTPTIGFVPIAVPLENDEELVNATTTIKPPNVTTTFSLPPIPTPTKPTSDSKRLMLTKLPVVLVILVSAILVA